MVLLASAREKSIGKKRRTRPGPAPMPAAERYQPIAIRLHPKVLRWTKKEGARRGIGYQTVINETLLERAG